MKHIARDSWVNAINAGGIQYLHEPRQYQELCSNTCLNNCKLSENTISSSNIISRGFYQTEAQKALQNSQIEKAFEVAEQYIQASKRKFFRFLDVETKKITLFKQLSRFDTAYVSTAKEKLKGLQGMGCGYDIQHITLTISHTKNADYIEKYKQLKSKLHDFIYFFRRVIKKKYTMFLLMKLHKRTMGVFISIYTLSLLELDICRKKRLRY